MSKRVALGFFALLVLSGCSQAAPATPTEAPLIGNQQQGEVARSSRGKPTATPIPTPTPSVVPTITPTPLPYSPGTFSAFIESVKTGAGYTLNIRLGDDNRRVQGIDTGMGAQIVILNKLTGQPIANKPATYSRNDPWEIVVPFQLAVSVVPKEIPRELDALAQAKRQEFIAAQEAANKALMRGEIYDPPKEQDYQVTNIEMMIVFYRYLDILVAPRPQSTPVKPTATSGR